MVHVVLITVYDFFSVLGKLEGGWLRGVANFCDGNYSKSFLPVPSYPKINSILT